jgi:hypothetical protein
MGRLFRAAADGVAHGTEDDDGLTPEVVVHVDADVLTGERDPADPDSVDRCHLDGGPGCQPRRHRASGL